jgi:predicted nucleic acid-binding protein
MARYLLDTDVLIDVSRGNADAASFIDSLNHAAISIIPARELIVGARDKRDLPAIDSLISTYSVEHIDAAIGLLAYDLLKRHGNQTVSARLTH